MLCTMVHGLSQGPQSGLSCSQGPSAVGLGGQPLLGGIRTLGQDLLQRQNVPLLLLGAGEKLPEDIPRERRLGERKGWKNKNTKLSTRREKKVNLDIIENQKNKNCHESPNPPRNMSNWRCFGIRNCSHIFTRPVVAVKVLRKSYTLNGWFFDIG